MTRLKVKVIIQTYLQPTKNEGAMCISSIPALFFHPMKHCCCEMGEGRGKECQDEQVTQVLVAR